MRKAISGVALVATFALAGPLAAQQAEHTSSQATSQAGMMAHMREMDSLATHVDSALALMNRTTGESRVNAIVQVLNALAAERMAMHAHMHRMHGPGGMMDKPRSEATKPHAHETPALTRPDTAHRVKK